MIITIVQAEGSNDCIGKPKTATSFAEATKILRHMANFVSNDGSAYKCDVTISDDVSGFKYTGTFPLYHWETEFADLKAYIVGNLSILAGDTKPHQVTDAEYQNFLEKFDPKWIEDCRARRDTCQTLA